MNGRNEKGQFTKYFKLSPEEQTLKSESLRKQWKERMNYIGDLINLNPYIYNSWRGIRFSKKGQKIGCSEEWKDFKTFYYDVIDTYIKGYTLQRKDKEKPFSKDNFIWMTRYDASLVNNENSVLIEYDGKILGLREWSLELEIPLHVIKQRYYSHKGKWTTEEILYGKKKQPPKEQKDYRKLSNEQQIRDKASKMISSYRIKDKKKGFDKPDYDLNWFIENIMKQECVYCGDNKRIGADRIDNNKGHTKDNIIPCCLECNTARSNLFTHEEMFMIGKVIKKIKKQRNKQHKLKDNE